MSVGEFPYDPGLVDQTAEKIEQGLTEPYPRDTTEYRLKTSDPRVTNCTLIVDYATTGLELLVPVENVRPSPEELRNGDDGPMSVDEVLGIEGVVSELINAISVATSTPKRTVAMNLFRDFTVDGIENWDETGMSVVAFRTLLREQ